MTRVLAFAVGLAGVFAGAFAVGSAFDVEPGRAEGAGHGGGAVHAAGLAVADEGLRLVAETTSFSPRRLGTFSFRILDDEEGRVLKGFDVEHERRMHLIVVRRDLSGFQHLHPTMDADGTWSVSLRLPAGGAYRAFADFSVDGEKRTLGIDLFAAGEAAPLPLPRSDVRLEETELVAGEEQTLRFDAGGPVERYLGAAGHLVVLREGDLGYLHTHAEEDVLEFETTFPSAGRYRAFLQVKRGGQVETAVFDLGAAP